MLHACHMDARSHDCKELRRQNSILRNTQGTRQGLNIAPRPSREEVSNAKHWTHQGIMMSLIIQRQESPLVVLWCKFALQPPSLARPVRQSSRRFRRVGLLPFEDFAKRVARKDCRQVSFVRGFRTIKPRAVCQKRLRPSTTKSSKACSSSPTINDVSIARHWSVRTSLCCCSFGK